MKVCRHQLNCFAIRLNPCQSASAAGWCSIRFYSLLLSSMCHASLTAQHAVALMLLAGCDHKQSFLLHSLHSQRATQDGGWIPPNEATPPHSAACI